jgi:hypothetical protein
LREGVLEGWQFAEEGKELLQKLLPEWKASVAKPMPALASARKPNPDKREAGADAIDVADGSGPTEDAADKRPGSKEPEPDWNA